MNQQFAERQTLQLAFIGLKQEHLVLLLKLKQDLALYWTIGADSQEKIEDQLPLAEKSKDYDQGPEK